MSVSRPELDNPDSLLAKGCQFGEARTRAGARSEHAAEEQAEPLSGPEHPHTTDSNVLFAIVSACLNF